MMTTPADNDLFYVLKQTLLDAGFIHVKILQFRSRCTALYTPHMSMDYWASSMQKLQVAYNETFYLWVNTSYASENQIIVALSNIKHSCLAFQSRVWRYWHGRIFQPLGLN